MIWDEDKRENRRRAWNFSKESSEVLSQIILETNVKIQSLWMNLILRNLS